jgi:hypothetical protein
MSKHFIIFVLILTSCIPFHNSKKDFGKIYGQLVLNPKSLNQKKALVNIPITVKPLGVKINPDSNGVFFINKLPIGKYSFEIKCKNYRSVTIKNVDVQKDSISLLFCKLTGYDKSVTPVEKNWKESKIKSVNLYKPGKICGTVKAMDYPAKLSKFTNVFVQDTFWGAAVDSNGHFCIENILPGKYTLKASAFGMHQSIFTNVEVLVDMTSIVNFQLIDIAIPERPFPACWKAMYKPMFENN